MVFEAIIFVLRTGCQWKALPAERFGSASAVRKRCLEWERAGFFEALWRAGLAEYDEAEKGQITDFRWHDLRHTWASWMAQAGTPQYILQELGG